GFAWVALAGSVVFLLASPGFQRYPGVLQSLFRPARVEAYSLFPSGDACGLPAMTYVGSFQEATARIRQLVASGQRVGILDVADPSLYLAADAPLWYRYSPLFPSIVTHKMAGQLERTLIERGPDIAVVRADPAYPQAFRSADLWQMLRRDLEQYYRRDGSSGAFEFWRRLPPVPTAPERSSR